MALWWTYWGAVWGVLLELSPWLLLGAVAAGLLHGLLPPDLIRQQLSGRWGVLKAVLLGVPLPLCSCGVIPTGISLKRDGASDGAAIGFLTATPQTGVDSILVSASFLGWPFALAKVVAALSTGIASGLLVESFSAPSPPSSPPSSQVSRPGLVRPGVWEMVDHGVDLIRMIWGWLVFGVLLSAGLTVLLPPGAFSGLATGAGAAVAFVAVLLISLPLYVCATASVPIAAALVAGGMPTGAAMVFLMAGPATNIATLGAVRQAFGSRTLAIYLGTIVVGSVAFGLLYESLLGTLSASGTALHHAAAAGHHDHTTGWAQASAGLLVVMLIVFASQDARVALSRLRRPAPSAPTPPQTCSLPVEGMTCGGCVSRLERTLLQTEGVETVRVSLEEKQATVTGPISPATLREAIQRAGFTTPSPLP